MFLQKACLILLEARKSTQRAGEFCNLIVMSTVRPRVEGNGGGSVTPQAAVARLADIIAARADFNEDEVYAAMADAGIPDPVADRAYKFTQIAWGRAVLAGLRVRLAPEYTCFNGSGEVIESGRLADE